MKKHAIFKKVKEHMYMFNGASDASMFTLFMFLGDGLYRQSYFEFLNDPSEQELYGNITSMHKQGNMVTVNFYSKIIPDMMPFTTSIKNLETIIAEWDRLRLLEVDSINFTLENDLLTMNGE